jgi:hypothetical protein
MTGKPFFITQNGEASMVIESVEQFQKKSKTHSTGFRRPCVFALLELDSV